MRKHPTLPNGFGAIKKLSGKRRNPYSVHPPARERNENGNYIQPTPLCYVPDWYTGFAVLTAYHAGNYKKGIASLLKSPAWTLMSSVRACLRTLPCLPDPGQGKRPLRK